MTETSYIGVGTVCVEMAVDGDAIMRMMRNGKTWEPETRRTWQALVNPNMMVLDVGAYTGVYSIASAHMGAKVIAIEPHPANFARLKLNAVLNSVRIDMKRVAASSACAPVMLRMKQPATVISDTASLEDSDGAISGSPVHTIRIDGLTFERPLGLIKIDVEHHERSVLRGALKTIDAHRPIIVVEVLSEAEGMNVDTLLKPFGYKVRAVMDKRNRLYAR